MFEEFLSPLILASYAINCFYICLQVGLVTQCIKGIHDEFASCAMLAKKVDKFVKILIWNFTRKLAHWQLFRPKL